MKKRLNKLLEITWLIIGISSLIALVYYYLNYGFDSIKPFLVIIPVSVVFYISRRKRGAKLEEEE